MKQTEGVQWKRLLYGMGLTLLGTLLLAFGTAVFILPFDLIVGGVSGMAIVIDALITAEVLTVDRILMVLTWSLFLLGFFVLGRSFAIKTLLSTLAYPPLVALFHRLASPDVAGGLFYLRESTYPELALILSATMGGAAIGAGCAVTFLGGGSTGGTDVLAFTLCRLFPRLKSARAIFVIDAAVILLGVFAIGDLLRSMLGIFSAMVTAVVIEKLFLGGSAGLVAEIVTKEAEAITQGVIAHLGRTTTLFEAIGGYSGQPCRMVSVSFSMRQYAHLMQIVREADPTAFVTVHRAHAINGEGWGKARE
ncbi:MAG: YitT family protein [Ruminococcaceae bacterium]|nr:YitT family protein [Oscillospiraceae bacterium]